MSTRWSVPKDWTGETVAVLASGPSMNQEVADYVRGKCRVIAVNNQGIDTEVDGVMVPALAPWADMLYAGDAKWWNHYRPRSLKFAGTKVTMRNALPYEELMFLEVSNRPPFDPRPTHVVSGGNSGYQAVHIAVQRGAARVVLCGFDMKLVKHRKHWHGNHTGSLNTQMNFPLWIRNFNSLAGHLKGMGIEVINCAHLSALQCFRYLPVEQAIRKEI